MDIRVFFLIYLIMFLIGSIGGYFLEFFYRRYSAKRWVNPGFNKGPWLPLYGFGLLLMFSITFLIYSIFPNSIALYNPLGNLFYRTNVLGPQWMDIVVILIMTFFVILLEFISGIIFVNGFKVRLWDYTNFKGNIKGVICPQFNVIWLFVCIIYYYALNPFIFILFSNLSDFFLSNSHASIISEFILIFIVGVFYGIFLIDFITSSGIFIKIVKLTKNNPIAITYDRLRDEVKLHRKEATIFLSKLIPEVVKTKMEINKKRALERKSKTENWFKNLIYIDPNRGVADDEYDENGRPAKFD